MLTGRDLIQTLERRRLLEQSEFDALLKALSQVEQRHAALIAEEARILDALARMYLPDLSPHTATAGLRELRGDMVRVLDDHEHRKTQLRARIERYGERVAELDGELRAVEAREDELDAQRITAEKSLADRLLVHGEFATRSEERESLVPGARRLERVRNGLIALATSEGPRYQRDRWFQYLRDCRWGSPLYHGGFIARRIDGWLARAIDFERRERNYKLLRTGPREIDLQLARTKSVIDQLDNRCRAIQDDLERQELHEILRFLKDVDDERRGLSEERARAMTAYENDASELRLLEQARGRFHEEAVELHRKALASKHVAEIIRIAESTARPDDDRLAEDLAAVRGELERNESLLRTIANRVDEHRVRIDAFLHLLREVCERFGDYRSRFRAGLDLDTLLDEWFAGTRTTGDILARIEALHVVAPRWEEIRPLARRAMLREESQIGVGWFDGTVNILTRMEDLM